MIFIGLFISLIVRVFKRRWYVTPGIPLTLMTLHGVYTGTWYIWVALIASLVLGALIALRTMLVRM
jgi:hypothetical protein